MQFRLLGALEVIADGHRIDPGGTRQQIVLATLLLNVGRVVSIDQLIEAVYDDPPVTARVQVQICISNLRKLFAAYGHPDAILTRTHGYVLQVDEQRIDARVFESHLSRARRARAGHDLDEAIRHYREALALWRGPALDGMRSRLVQLTANELNEHRIAVNEECVDLELELGRHHELIGELSRLVKAYPLRERLLGQLMLALYRCGRQVEALQVYRDARQMMVDELGIEPHERLQQLEYLILTSAEDLERPVQAAPRRPPDTAKPPAMVPAAIADFTGRDEQVALIREKLTAPPAGTARFAVPVVAIVGRAGIGKTTLAVHCAHEVAELFPDGQLFAGLHGGTPNPAGPAKVLERFLRVLGVPGHDIPDTLEERAEMYRTLLAERRVLVVLDDVSGEHQVLPLLPGSRQAAVIITSRTRLGGLPGAFHLGLDALDSARSVQLISQIAGEDRVQADPTSSASLAELCEGLPLALRIAGSRLAARPHWDIRQLVSRLEDEARRLDELKHGTMGIRANLSLIYDGLGEPARRLFRLLATLNSHILPTWAAAAALDQPVPVVQDLLDELADTHFIEAADSGLGVRTNYRFHDLVRVFAKERLAAEEPPAERAAALERMLHTQLVLTTRAQQHEFGFTELPLPRTGWRPPLSDDLIDQLVASPLEWFERERRVLVAGIHQAMQAGFAELCWRLTAMSTKFFEARAYLDDWRETHRLALEAARQAQDRLGQAMMLFKIGTLSVTEQRFSDARHALEEAAEIFADLRDDRGRAMADSRLAILDRLSGRFDDAAERFDRALTVFGGDDGSVSADSVYILFSKTKLYLDCGRPDESHHLLSEVLEFTRSSGDRRMRAQVMFRLGETHFSKQEFAAGEEAYAEALSAVREIGDRMGEAFILLGLGTARFQQGEPEVARDLLQQARELARTTRQHLVETQAVTVLGELALAGGDVAQAHSLLDQAARFFAEMELPLLEAQARVLLRQAYMTTGDHAAAEAEESRVQQLIEQIDPQPAQRIRERLAQAQQPGR
ncbi:BTAD domain-containing putative transcriptional regulator [Planomonospora corallina]|uniref:BTAD domain-containing putative transcriptional regulator n=1 Tax=Planomonospora corallina TaxID=1806052 RepID=A0ABV8I2J7_9ACTN